MKKEIFILMALCAFQIMVQAQVAYDGSAFSPYMSEESSCIKDLAKQLNATINENYKGSAAVFIVFEPDLKSDSAFYAGHLCFSSNDTIDLSGLDQIIAKVQPITLAGCEVDKSKPFTVPLAILEPWQRKWAIGATTDFYKVPQARSLLFLLKSRDDCLSQTYWHLRDLVAYRSHN